LRFRTAIGVASRRAHRLRDFDRERRALRQQISRFKQARFAAAKIPFR
jgi:hypothetical protein